MPIFITPAVGYRDNITLHIEFLSMPTAAGILKTFPAYDLHDTVAIYTIPDTVNPKQYQYLLHHNTRKILVGNGLIYIEVDLQ